MTSLSVLRAVWPVARTSAVAAACLYALLLAFAEPLHSVAAADSEQVVVSLNVTDDLSNTCTTPVTLGTVTRTGDTSQNTCGATGTCLPNATVCTVSTNSSNGYSFSWIVQTGTGAAGARTGTGHLNGFVAGNRIAPLGTGSTVASGQPIAMTAGAGTLNNDARWAGRVSSSTTDSVENGGSKVWGADGVSDTWLRIATGSAVNVAGRASQMPGTGDYIKVGFRAIIHGTKIVPTDTYKATVTFTATTN